MNIPLMRPFNKLVPYSVRAAYYICKSYKQHFGHYPNLIAPRTLTEKIQKAKLFKRDPRMPMMQDKVLIKDIARDLLGEPFVIPTLWHGKQLPPREQRNWPYPFVIKANHGCGWNIFVRNQQECDWEMIEARCEKWMQRCYGYYLGEWLYREISPQLLVEPYISDIADLPTDYKLWVFNGKVEYIMAICGRGTDHAQEAYYDTRWVKQAFTGGIYDSSQEEDCLPKPISLPQMIAAAEKLAQGFDFVRVDFYEVNAQPLLGEMTFYPGSGHMKFNPEKMDKVLGAYWD